MKSDNNPAKQLALKIFLLNQTQRNTIHEQINELPSSVHNYLEELAQRFPVLARLNATQRKAVHASVVIDREKSEWEILNTHMSNFDQVNNQHPSKLHAIILGH